MSDLASFLRTPDPVSQSISTAGDNFLEAASASFSAPAPTPAAPSPDTAGNTIMVLLVLLILLLLTAVIVLACSFVRYRKSHGRNTADVPEDASAPVEPRPHSLTDKKKKTGMRWVKWLLFILGLFASSAITTAINMNNQAFEEAYHWDYMEYPGPGNASVWDNAAYSMASVFANAFAAPASYIGNAGQVLGNKLADKYNPAAWKPVNPYGEFSIAARNARASRQAVANSLSPVGSFLYQTGMSMADNLILMPTGPAGTLALMALEAADAQYAQEVDNVDGQRLGGLPTVLIFAACMSPYWVVSRKLKKRELWEDALKASERHHSSDHT